MLSQENNKIDYSCGCDIFVFFHKGYSAMRKNILFINHSVRDGGPGRSLFYILKYMDREKLNPYVLIPKDDIFSNLLKDQGLYHNVIVDKRFPENLFTPRLEYESVNKLTGNIPLARKIIKLIYAVINVLLMADLVIRSGSLIRKNSIDAIYCNGTIAKIVGAFMGYFNGCKVIWHVRNIQQTAVLSYIINHLSGFRVVKRIHCVSNATAMQFKNSTEKIVVIYNGLDPGEYDPQSVEGRFRNEKGIDDDTVLIGSTGRLVPRKGYDQFISHAGVITERISPEMKIKFVIIGDTPHFFHMDYKKHLEDMVAACGLGDKFCFTGYISDVRQYLRDFDIFVIPSNYPDPFPRSVIEAMSLGIPVVGFAVGGIREAIVDGKSGFLSEPGDYKSMMDNITRLVENKELREEMGANARKRVIDNYDAKKISKQIQSSILEVL